MRIVYGLIYLVGILLTAAAGLALAVLLFTAMYMLYVNQGPGYTTGVVAVMCCLMVGPAIAKWGKDKFERIGL